MIEVIVEDDKNDSEYVQNTELPKYMIYLMSGVIALLIIIFIIWYCVRKQMMLNVRKKINNLRTKGRPENLVKEEIKTNLKQIKFESKKEEMDPCAICCDDFKQKELIIQTECNHLFHEMCVWQWIETKLKLTINEMEQEADQGVDLNSLHPRKDCVQCPNCN